MCSLLQTPDFMISFPLVHLSAVWFAPWAWLWPLEGCGIIPRAPLQRKASLPSTLCIFLSLAVPYLLYMPEEFLMAAFEAVSLCSLVYQAAPVSRLFQEKATPRVSIPLAALNKWGFEKRAENFETSALKIINAETAMVATRGRRGEGWDMGENMTTKSESK